MMLSIKKYKSVVIILAIVCLLELFVFNFRHWESLSNKEITNFSVNMAEGFVRQEDGTYLLREGDKYLEITDVDARLNTLRMDIEILDTGDEYSQVTLQQWARDESHELYYRLPDREIWHVSERSQYLNYHFYGNCKSLRIAPALGEGTHIRISYEINPVIPLFFFVQRVLVIFFLFLFLYLFRPASAVYRVPFLSMKSGKTMVQAVFLVMHVLLIVLLLRVNPFFQWESMDHHRQYQKLAESFLQGKVYLQEEPSTVLQEMENPYDYDYRVRLISEAGQGFLWDHAYYEGKYYVYFGVVPAVLFYFPYYVITGTHLHNNQVIFLGAVLMVLALMGIVSKVIERWFPETSVGIWYLLSELLVLGSGLVYICKRPDLYTVPIVMGLAFGLFGFLCILCGEKEGRLSTPCIALGSLCTALVAGCRPQLFAVIFLSVILLSKYIFSPDYLKSKAGKRNVLAYVVPMLIVAGLLMWYNYARFGSVFDFGANYNLTFNDMRRRGFVADRIPLGIWAYLFSPVRTVLTFPFMEANFFSSNYLGVTISEATYGGIFAVNLFVWLCPALLVFRKYITGNRVGVVHLAYASMLIAILIVLTDTEMSGILMRYVSDYSVFFLLAAMIAALIFDTSLKRGVLRNTWLYFLTICLLITVTYQGLIFFLDTGEALQDLRKDLFVQVKYQVMFWL